MDMILTNRKVKTPNKVPSTRLITAPVMPIVRKAPAIILISTGISFLLFQNWNFHGFYINNLITFRTFCTISPITNIKLGITDGTKVNSAGSFQFPPPFLWDLHIHTVGSYERLGTLVVHYIMSSDFPTDDASELFG